ncbi:MAG: hypothetical protein QGG74_02220 [Phycisphaerales bacterium]|nr:hypothetical protein [Phycisphaerales bacterium]
MSAHKTPDPLSHAEMIDAWFLEHRAKVLDLAAFLDRLDRAGGPPTDDFRVAALRAAIAMLIDGQDDRTRRIQLLLSDRTSEPIDAAPMQGALGAVPLAARQ